MAGNGATITTGWKPNVGGAELNVYIEPPAAGATETTATWTCYVNSIPGRKVYLNYYVHSDLESALYPQNSEWLVYTVPGSGTAAVYVQVAQWHLRVPARYAHEAAALVSGSVYINGSSNWDTAWVMSDSWQAPARPYPLPTDPTAFTASRISDYQVNIGWSTSASPTQPIHNCYVDRWDNVSNAWSTVASWPSVGTGTWGWSDTGVVPNRRYQYRVVNQNTSGYSNYVYSGFINTTPAYPSEVTTSRNGTTLTTTWRKNNTTADGVVFEVSHKAGTAAWAVKTSTLAGDQSSYTITGITLGIDHQVRVRAISGALTSGYGTGNVVSTASAPNAPTVTLAGSVFNLSNPFQVSWIHNPTDTTAQTAAQVRYREVNTATWTTIALGAVSSYNITGLANGKTYEIQVATKGDHASYGPFSASQLVVGSTPPTANITAPGATTTTSDLAVTFTYYDAEATVLTAWRIRLLQGTAVLLDETQNDTLASGSAKTVTWPSVLSTNNTVYTIEVSVKDSSGVWSAVATKTTTTNYPIPTKATLYSEFSPDTGSVRVRITNPTPVVGESVPVSQALQRLDNGVWGTILDNLSIAATTPGVVSADDPIPPLVAGVQYRVLTRSALGVVRVSDPTVVDANTDEQGWIYLNGGSGWGVLARLRVSPRIPETISRYKELYTFEGFQKALEFAGDEISVSVQLSGQVATYATDPLVQRRGTWPAFRDIAKLPAPICYRNPLGQKMFTSIGPVQVDHDADSGLTSISASLIEVDETDVL